MSAVGWRNDEDRVERLARGDEPARGAVIDGKVGQVVDLSVLRPEHERVATFIGVALARLEWWCERGLIWSARWAARRIRAWRR